MAKFGEGDKRWIVTDRPDGTNVHNWHWSETDCIEFSRNLLSSLLTNLTIIDGNGGLHVTIVSLDKVEGEAYVNVRKGKIIPGYELSIKMSWIGEVTTTDDEATMIKIEGGIEVPYLSDENAGEDPEVKVTVKDEGPIGRRMKEAVLVKGKEIVCEKIRIYVENMAKGGPCREELEAKKVVKGSNSSSSSEEKKVAAAGVVKKSEESDAVVGKGKEKGVVVKERKGFKTIKMTEKFSCRALDMYEILMDENRWKGFTQSNARISREVGGEISLFDGSVTGTNVELQPGKLIVQKWRFGSWPDGIYSEVKLTFDEPESGVTVIKLVQTDVPEEDRYGNETVVENTERGWRDLIFHKIRAIFGFGL